MIAELLFGPPREESDGRSVREATLGRATSLPLALACSVAREAAERIGQLLARELEAEVVEPVSIDCQISATVLAEARGLRVRGQNADTFVMIRPLDARALVATAFGAPPRAEELSPLEWRIVERLLGAVASSCAPLCGTLLGIVAESAARAQSEARAYFEIRIIKPCRAAIGIALTREPPMLIQTTFSLAALNDVPLDLRVTAGRATLSVADLGRLEIGALVELNERLEATSRISTDDGTVVAEGVLGVEAGRYALQVSELANA